VSGGTNSTNLNFTNGHTLSYQGGIGDGYLFRLGAGNNPTVINGTYIGSNEYDQVYFVQTDVSDNVFILGQTEAFMPITPGLYGNPNSGQFIRKYTPDLVTMQWNTTIGAGSGHVEISPTAFLVSDCNEIYLSGWGGTLNSNSSVSQAVNSSSNGMPVTPDAYQSTTTGNNFYIAVLGQDAQTLKYGTFMGGMSNVSPNHVDGGTSRFDKSGFMYHSVCASCGASNTGFSTTPGAFSTTSQSSNCNLAIFKFELNKIEAIIGEPEPLICLPDMVHFVNNSANGNTFNWNFGDGNTSLLENPSHLYGGPGNYTVTLVVSDSSGCFSPDSVTFQINLGIYSGEVNSISSAICPGTPFQLNASGGTSYLWSPANVLDNPTIPNPTATVFETTTFSVIIADECGVDTFEVVLPVFSANAQASNDTSICIGNSVPLFASGGGTYLWSPSDYLDNPTSATPTSTPTETITYTIDIVTPNGCELTENVQIQVFFTPPIPVIPDTVLVCRGGSKQITVSGADTYMWDFSPIINPLNSPTITITPTSDQWLYCNFFNACGLARDSVYVKIVDPSITVSPDTIICPGKVAMLVATGGVSYQWFPTIGLNTAVNDTVYASPNQTTAYQVIGVDQNGCIDSAIVTVGIFPTPFIQTVPDVYAFIGDQIVLGATSSSPGTIYWSPAEFLSCVVCLNPIANPNKNFIYTVYFTDINGCQASDNVHIYYDAIIYIPNTFTPNNSMLNEIFKAEGGNIKQFKLTIYNRWGEKIKILTSLDDYWDGTYKGIPCQDGTYVWKLEYTDFSENEFKRVGHINLLR
jgi:gliding motility-associated-like protein